MFIKLTLIEPQDARDKILYVKPTLASFSGEKPSEIRKSVATTVGLKHNKKYINTVQKGILFKLIKYENNNIANLMDKYMVYISK